MIRRSGLAPDLRRAWWLAVFALCGCAAPVLTASSPGPGVPKITALEITPARINAGCSVTLRIDFEDLDGDVVQAVIQLARREENEVRSTYGGAYARYASVTPAFIPPVRGITKRHPNAESSRCP